MGNLDGYDANDHDPLDERTLLPKGKYKAIAVESQNKDNSKKTGSYLEIVWKIIEGEHKGRRQWSRLNLNNPSPEAVAIAKSELSSICRATKVMKPGNSTSLHGIAIVLSVGVETRKDNGELANKVTGYKAIDTSAPSAPADGGEPVAPWKQ